jgi:hypothetical protein
MKVNNNALSSTWPNHKLSRAQAAESAAPFRVRWIEPHQDAACHRHNTDDLAADLMPGTNTNAAPNREPIPIKRRRFDPSHRAILLMFN